MNTRKNVLISAIAALSGASMLALSMGQASALTLLVPAESLAPAQVELVGFHHGGGGGGWGHGGGYHGGYWGHGGGYYGGHGYWGHGYWGSSYWGHPYFPPRPCSIFGGSLHCYPL